MLPEPADLIHPLVQDGDDADVAAREPAPVDEMVLVVEEIPIDTELGQDGPRTDAPGFDLIEGRENAGDIAVGLIGSPSLPCVAVDVIEAQRCRLLNADGHPVRSCSGRSPRPR